MRGRQLSDGVFQEPKYGEEKGELMLHWNISRYDFFMTVTYEPATASTAERIRMFLKMPDKMWFSIGFGSSMTNVDMISWFANGDESYAKDYWSTSKKAPAEDDSQDVSTPLARKIPAAQPGDLDYVAFVSYRPLDTGDSAQDYLIQLGQEMDMVYGFRYRSSAWYRHDKRGWFSMKVDESLGRLDVMEKELSLDDFDIMDGPDIKIEVPTDDEEEFADDDTEEEEDEDLKPEEEAFEEEWEKEVKACLAQSWDGGNFYIKVCHDEDTQELVFTTSIPNNSWLGIGFGTKMKNTDMMVWQAVKGFGVVRDLYSYGYGVPKMDEVQNLDNVTKFDKKKGMVNFVTRRKLDTGDSDKDFLIKMNEDIPMSYAHAMN